MLILRHILIKQVKIFDIWYNLYLPKKLIKKYYKLKLLDILQRKKSFNLCNQVHTIEQNEQKYKTVCYKKHIEIYKNRRSTHNLNKI